MFRLMKGLYNLINNIIWRKAEEKSKNWDFKTAEEFWTYIYEHELPFVEAEQKQWWYKSEWEWRYHLADGNIY